MPQLRATDAAERSDVTTPAALFGTTAAAPTRLDGVVTSPLVMCDRLLTLAQEADRAGFCVTARQLLGLAHSVCDEKAARLAS